MSSPFGTCLQSVIKLTVHLRYKAKLVILKPVGRCRINRPNLLLSGSVAIHRANVSFFLKVSFTTNQSTDPLQASRLVFHACESLTHLCFKTAIKINSEENGGNLSLHFCNDEHENYIGLIKACPKRYKSIGMRRAD